MEYIKAVDECQHDLRCIHRHPTSDQRCTKCGAIFKYPEAVKYNAQRKYDEGKISLVEFRRLTS